MGPDLYLLLYERWRCIAVNKKRISWKEPIRLSDLATSGAASLRRKVEILRRFDQNLNKIGNGIYAVPERKPPLAS
jgi:hypothetical protein